MMRAVATPDSELPLPVIEVEQAIDVIVRFIRAQLEQTGFRRLVVAVSGGVDSATVAFLCGRAVPAEDLLALLLPHRSSSRHSEDDARAVVDALGCRSERIDISPMVDPMLATMDQPSARIETDALNVRRGNVMARQRMIVLYDRSAAFDALVAGTSNKTELLLGYSTLWGDMAAALLPIGDLYKSQLRSVATHLGVPRQVLDKAPTADLWPGQTDEAELGATYDQLDRILYALVDRRWTRARIVAAGCDSTLVDLVARRVARFEYKRQMPPIAKVSLRTPGIDHLYPRRRPGSRRA
jgi:NAD+ synthase